MSSHLGQADRRILLLAPTARDAAATCHVLADLEIECVTCRELDELCHEMTRGVGIIVVPEEIVIADKVEQLAGQLRKQPVWSDLPVFLLLRTGTETMAVEAAIKSLGNVSLIERPVRVSTLLSMVRSGLRARERQLQVRDQMQERERLLASERNARAEADAANKAKDQFLAKLSHELRTPLSPVVLALTAIENDPILPKALQRDIAMIRRNIDLETKLIDDLLDLSRVIAGKLRLDLQPTSVHGVLEHVFQVCAADLQAKRVELRVEFDATNDQVVADAARLEQVFWNLLQNAVKFTPARGRITVRTRTTSDTSLAIDVEDTGEGIAANMLPRIFDPFEQGEARRTRQFGGLGLGLSISKAVVDMHGGQIRAHSAGRSLGARFSVELPTTQASLAKAVPQAAPQPSSVQGTKPRVLLVEDHPDTALILSRLLALTGYEVTTASSVAAALETAGRSVFDVVVSDIGLPDASGYELMRQLQQRCDIKGIALSGFGTEEDTRQSRAAGFADHLVKPVSITQLTAVLNRVVSR